MAGRRAAGVPARSIAASVAHGRAVAARLARWARSDGQAGTLGRPYVPPTGEGLWESTPPNFRPAMPSGHWMQIAAQVITAREVWLDRAVETRCCGPPPA